MFDIVVKIFPIVILILKALSKVKFMNEKTGSMLDDYLKIDYNPFHFIVKAFIEIALFIGLYSLIVITLENYHNISYKVDSIIVLIDIFGVWVILALFLLIMKILIKKIEAINLTFPPTINLSCFSGFLIIGSIVMSFEDIFLGLLYFFTFITHFVITYLECYNKIVYVGQTVLFECYFNDGSKVVCNDVLRTKDKLILYSKNIITNEEIYLEISKNAIEKTIVTMSKQ